MLAAAAHFLERRGRRVALAIGFSMLLPIVATALFLSGGALDEGLPFEREKTPASVQPARSPASEASSESPQPSQTATATADDHGSRPKMLPAETKPDPAMPYAGGSNGAAAVFRGADPPAALADGRTESQAVDPSPKGPPAKASRPPAKGRVQLAAPDTIAEAERVWAELQAAQVDVLGEVRVTVSRAALSDGRVVYRLQTVSMAAEDAQRLCETLRQRQVPCFVRR